MMEFISYVIYFLIMGLFMLGIWGMLDKSNLMKKLMSMNIMQVAVIVFFLTLGQKSNAMIPVLVPGLPGVENYVNPLPHALMLTAIVVSLSTVGVSLSILLKIQKNYNSLEEDEIARGMDE